ncbi:MAG: hypothetical protein HFJ41_02865 [Clostridia bacterium]|nr:hypothetical protein [Clostridia bacterium]
MEMPKEYRCEYVYLTEHNIQDACNKMLEEGFVFDRTVVMKENFFAYLLFAKY